MRDYIDNTVRYCQYHFMLSTDNLLIILYDNVEQHHSCSKEKHWFYFVKQILYEELPSPFVDVGLWTSSDLPSDWGFWDISGLFELFLPRLRTLPFMAVIIHLWIFCSKVSPCPCGAVNTNSNLIGLNICIVYRYSIQATHRNAIFILFQ